MIVDTSALIAVAQDEPGSEELRRAILAGSLVPAPVLVEFERVITHRGSRLAPEGSAMLQNLLAAELQVMTFTSEDATVAAAANMEHGAGNGRGGTLNLLDLMVYAVARRTGLPLLCTGRDFVGTGIELHPASRLD